MWWKIRLSGNYPKPKLIKSGLIFGKDYGVVLSDEEMTGEIRTDGWLIKEECEDPEGKEQASDSGPQTSAEEDETEAVIPLPDRKVHVNLGGEGSTQEHGASEEKEAKSGRKKKKN